MEVLGAKLMILRKQIGLTQDELGERIGSSQKTISSWETGRTYPRMRDINALCMALDCTIEELTGKKVREVIDISYDDIVMKLNDLDTDELIRLKNMISEKIENHTEIERMKNENRALDKQLSEYAKRISELEAELKKGGKITRAKKEVLLL